MFFYCSLCLTLDKNLYTDGCEMEMAKRKVCIWSATSAATPLKTIIFPKQKYQFKQAWKFKYAFGCHLCMYVWVSVLLAHQSAVRICASWKFQMMVDFKTMLRDRVSKCGEISCGYGFLLFISLSIFFFISLCFWFDVKMCLCTVWCLGAHWATFKNTLDTQIHTYIYQALFGIVLLPTGFRALNINALIYIESERQTHTYALLAKRKEKFWNERANKRTRKNPNRYIKQNSSKTVLFPFLFVPCCYHIEYTLSPLHRTVQYSSDRKIHTLTICV